MNSKTILWFVLAGMLVLLGVVAFYKAAPILFPEIQVEATLNPDCDLRAGPCRISFPDGSSVTFSITPRTIPVIQPLNLEVKIDGLEAESVEVDFSGTEMYMGFNRVKLKAGAKGQYTGVGRIPVCVLEAMEWEAKVMIKSPKGLYIAPYRFITVKKDILPAE